MSAPKKVVLAYSGGLDTSVILAWLKQTYQCQVVTFTADIGQGEELESARKKAQAAGVEDIFIEDLKETFVRDYVFPMFRANAVYEGTYLLGTAIARPLIAKRQVEIATLVGADAVCHGATGKGNDQVRFELGYYALSPDIEVIAPWRQWSLNSRETLLTYAKDQGIVIEQKRGQAPPYSMDANLLHISYEGGELEDPAVSPDTRMWQRTVDIDQAPNLGETIKISFQKGDPVAIDDCPLTPAQLLTRLNTVAGRHGIGRVDIVENRSVGMKSRGCYETPGGTVLLTARRALESLTLDREVMHLKDDLMTRYATLIYNGYWWSPERVLLQGLFDQSQAQVNGQVVVHLCKGNVIIRQRMSDDSLFNENIATFEEDAGAYDQRDAEGFIKLNALRLRLLASKAK